MGYPAAAGIKEHQIAGLQIGFGYPGAHAILVTAGAGKRDTVPGENILHKAGAIKAAGSGTAP